MKNHLTAGSIIFDRSLNKIAVIKKNSRNEYLLPKGHVEKGEDLFQTAQREAIEETGLKSLLFIDKQWVYLDHFEFEKDGEKNVKDVYFFISIAIDDSIVTTDFQIDEDLALVWMDRDEANEKLSYESLKQAVNKAYDKVRTYHINR